MTEIEFTHGQSVDVINFMGGDDNVAMSAWVSFGNDREERLTDRAKVRGLINFLYKNGHHTPFESSVFTFRVETPIFVAREFFRHRSASYNEMSGRYTIMPKKFYVPEEGVRPLQQEGKAGNYYFVPGTYAQGREVDGSVRRTVEHCVQAYDKMLDAGVAKEVARMVLPLNIYTQFYVTMNARNLMHFLTLRSDSTALYEIRQLAGQMEKALKEKMPLTYEAYKAKQVLKDVKPVDTPSISITAQTGQDWQIFNDNIEAFNKSRRASQEEKFKADVRKVMQEEMAKSRLAATVPEPASFARLVTVSKDVLESNVNDAVRKTITKALKNAMNRRVQ